MNYKISKRAASLSPSLTLAIDSKAKQMKADGHIAKDIAKFLGVSRATLYRYLADEAA